MNGNEGQYRGLTRELVQSLDQAKFARGNILSMRVPIQIQGEEQGDGGREGGTAREKRRESQPNKLMTDTLCC